MWKKCEVNLNATRDLRDMRSQVSGPDGATQTMPTNGRDSAINHQRLVEVGATEEKPTKKADCTEKCAFECDAQWPFKGTYVRQDILHKTNQMEEQNPQSASALYVPLPHFT